MALHVVQELGDHLLLILEECGPALGQNVTMRFFAIPPAYYLYDSNASSADY
jgi:hypothetical protein